MPNKVKEGSGSLILKAFSEPHLKRATVCEMGAFLDKPKTEKETAKGEGNGIKYGVSAMQGWRMNMEDKHICTTDLFMKDSSFFGVFDGHAGFKVAEYSADKLIECIYECFKKEKNLVGGITKGFMKLDDEMCTKWLKVDDRSGTTAVAAMITPSQIIFANCGDSRGILCRDSKAHFATEDHKPYNEGERLRIEKAGGTVMMQRVNGSLAVSRALGDFDYKKKLDFEPSEQLVSPEPDITAYDRNEEKDQFLLLACDGIFDVMTNDEVVSFVLRRLEYIEDLSVICSDLIDTCLNKVCVWSHGVYVC